LPAGNYSVDVKKEGYTDWTKTVNLKGEIVLSLEAVLFPKNASLSPLTNLGVTKAVPIDQSDKILLFSATGDIEKDGIYIFDPSSKPLSFFPPLKLIVLKKNLPTDIDFSNVSITFSPDSDQAVAQFTTPASQISYLLSLNGENASLFDITGSKETLLDAWRMEKEKEVTKILETFPKSIRAVAPTAFSVISFSPDETKVLYQAKQDVYLTPAITPALIGTNQTVEARSIKKDQIYVYDKKEDKNFLLPFEKIQETNISPTLAMIKNTDRRQPLANPTISIAPQPLTFGEHFPIIWYADSKHLSMNLEHEIVMIDYDGTNRRTIYSGPFESDFFFITSGGKLFVLTNLNPQYNQYADLYEVGIR
jgi:uncharacterized protein YcgL (UPF0745 family)